MAEDGDSSLVKNGEESEEEQPSHDLLVLEEDDGFENLDLPSLQDEDEGRSFIPIEKKRFLHQAQLPLPRSSPIVQTKRRKNRDKSDLEKSVNASVNDIAHLTTDQDHVPVSMVKSSSPLPSAVSISVDSTLPSDMLISLIPSHLRVEDSEEDKTSSCTSSPDVTSQYPTTTTSGTSTAGATGCLVAEPDTETAEKARRARMDSTSQDDREFEDEDVHSSSWTTHRKHVFILSISGKPIYSRYGKEERLVTTYGIMQALVSLVQDDKDVLRSVCAGSHKIVFLCKNPLVLVAASSSPQSEHQLMLQLHFTYYQILSVLTNTQLQQVYNMNPSVDFRNLLQGSEKFLDNILRLTDEDPSMLLTGVRCVPMSASLRQSITSALMNCRTKSVLFALVVANNQIISYIKPKDYNLHPIDIHLIFNLVDASTSFRSAESWTPICLPKFNDTGFLHAYVSFFPNNSPACLLLISTDKEQFFELKECKEKILEKLSKQNLLDNIKQSIEGAEYSIKHLDAPEIRHFLYRSRKTLMVTYPEIPLLYSEEEDKMRLIDHYMTMNQRLHSHTWPTKILYSVGSHECLLGWRTSNFDLYTLFDPLISKPQAIMLGNKLIRWINKEEDRLIITSSVAF